MAGSALSIVRSASQQLASLLVEEAKFLYDVNEKMEELHLHLQCIQCFLEDAERNQYKSQLVNQWIFQIREFAYDAENIIEKYVIRVSHQHRGEGAWNILKWFSCVLCDAKALHEVGSDIDTLSRRISKLTSIMQLCGLKVDVTKDSGIINTALAELRRTNSKIEEDGIVVGFDKDVTDLVEQLVNVDKTFAIISGMGGLGKTTLAKMVYKNKTIKGHFDGFVWIYISQQFVVREVLELIWSKLLNTDDDDREKIKRLSDNELQSKLKSELQIKKYLIVLDDIWNKESWSRLKGAFPSLQKSQSKLLLTTRNTELIEYVDEDNGYLHHPTRLTVEESWDLLRKIASKESYTIGDNMEELGKDMIQHCDCLPLAIVTLGGILGSKKTKDEWEMVKDNLHSYLANGEGSVVVQVLELSYNELPFYLRPCFLYLATFPEDHEIRTESLYHMWVAEGLVMPPSDNDIVSMGKSEIFMEDMAEKYLNELVKRCLVQVERRGETGKVEICHLHDMMRDMCIKKAKEENFLSITTDKEIEGQGNHTPSTSSTRVTTISAHRLHRLAIHPNDSGDQRTNEYLVVKKPTSQHLRSLFVYTRKHISGGSLGSLIGTSSQLRVLCLENSGFVYFPKKAGEFIHLRYLSLFGVEGLGSEWRSSFVGDLLHLETLDLRVEGFSCLPNMLGKLKRLKHLYLPQNYYIKSKKIELHSLTCLETLENLNLRYSPVEDLFTLKGLRKFTWKVRDLYDRSSLFYPSDEKTIEGLLAVYASSRLIEKSTFVKMHEKMLTEEYISKLVNLPGYEFVQGLSIRGDAYELSDKELDHWMRFDSTEILFQNITSLRIERTGLCYDPMSILQRLCNLRKLCLKSGSILVDKITCSAGGFPQLTFLMMKSLPLEEWEVERGSMPRLEQLRIEELRNLKQLPEALIGTTVDIQCRWPCIQGIERHGTCPHFKGWEDFCKDRNGDWLYSKEGLRKEFEARKDEISISATASSSVVRYLSMHDSDEWISGDDNDDESKLL